MSESGIGGVGYREKKIHRLKWEKIRSGQLLSSYSIIRLRYLTKRKNIRTTIEKRTNNIRKTQKKYMETECAKQE